MIVAYIALFSAWLVLTVFWQFEYCREHSRFLRTMSVLHVLPIWTFFAPRPGMSDTHILYRDKGRDDTITDWQEVTLAEQRRIIHFLWNPRKRMDKLAVDAVAEVKSIKNRAVADGIEEDILQHQIKLSKGYLILLNIVFAETRVRTESTWRQFVVVDATHLGGERSISPIFFSPFHEFSE
jgi:hypothetical protein